MSAGNHGNGDYEDQVERQAIERDEKGQLDDGSPLPDGIRPVKQLLVPDAPVGSVGGGGGTTKLVLPDGMVVSLCDWTDRELCATFDITPGGQLSQWEPFTASRRMPIQESGRRATDADASHPIGSSSGAYLPKEWEALVFGWRATVHAPEAVLKSDELAAFLASTSAQLMYNSKEYTTLPLSDLVRMKPVEGDEDGRADVGDWIRQMLPGAISLPLRMREMLTYGVKVYADDASTLTKLRVILSKHDTPLMVRLHLRCLLKRTVV